MSQRKKTGCFGCKTQVAPSEPLQLTTNPLFNASTNSRNPSRNPSRNASRNPSRNAVIPLLPGEVGRISTSGLRRRNNVATQASSRARGVNAATQASPRVSPPRAPNRAENSASKLHRVVDGHSGFPARVMPIRRVRSPSTTSSNSNTQSSISNANIGSQWMLHESYYVRSVNGEIQVRNHNDPDNDEYIWKWDDNEGVWKRTNRNGIEVSFRPRSNSNRTSSSRSNSSRTSSRR